MATVTHEVRFDGAELSCFHKEDLAATTGERVMWCDHIEAVIANNLDAEHIDAGDSLKVPIYPFYNIWTDVDLERIGASLELAKIKMTYIPQFTPAITEVMGIWTKGEGRLSLRAVALNQIFNKFPGMQTLGDIYRNHACPSAVHNIESINKNSAGADDPRWVGATVWCLAYEAACLACVLSSDPASAVPDPDGRRNRWAPGGGVPF